MKVYVEFAKATLRVKIKSEELEVRIPPNFYSPIPNTESYQMFRDREIVERLKKLVDRHRATLSIAGKLLHWCFRNNVLVLVPTDVQPLANIEQLHAYATLYLDGMNVSIVRKPEAFDSTRLEAAESLRPLSINRYRSVDVRAPISNVP